MQKLCKEQELMKYSTKLSDAVHILAFIVLNPNGSLTSDSIAKSVHTNPECGVGIYIQLSLQDFFDQIQQKAEEEMKSITLQDVIDRYEEKTAHLGIGSF